MQQLTIKSFLSTKRKCELLGIARSSLYYRKEPMSEQDQALIEAINTIYEQYPFYGYRKMQVALRQQGHHCNRKKVARLMKISGLQAVHPKKRNKTTISKHHLKYPYLLKDLVIDVPNVAWQVDITYIETQGGYVYLICIIDVYSRRIMGWNLAIFLDVNACLGALKNALKHATPSIVNSDQGSQFTSEEWANFLTQHGIQISMDGKGRWADNIYIERLWRTVKYELIYLNNYDSVNHVRSDLACYIIFYNSRRPHQSLGYTTPDETYFTHYLKQKNNDFVLNNAQPSLTERTNLSIFSC
jgi:putative transposase